LLVKLFTLPELIALVNKDLQISRRSANNGSICHQTAPI